MPENWDIEDACLEPVEGACIFCKKTPDEAMEHVEWLPVGDDEQLCSICAQDLRKYKRTNTFSIFVDSDIPQGQVRDAMKSAGQLIYKAIPEEYKRGGGVPEPATSNASEVKTEDE